MKKLHIILSILLLVNFTYAQFGTSYEQVQTILKTGDTLNGYGKLDTYKLFFKDAEKKNKKKYPYSEIVSVKFTLYSGKNNSTKKELLLFPIVIKPEDENTEKQVMVELLYLKDKIKIYGVCFVGGGYGMGVGMSAGMSGQAFTFSNVGGGSLSWGSYSDYYCYIKEAKYPKVMYQYTNLFKTFRIMASECFSDCIVLSKKINDKEFTKEDVTKIGDFYNNNCN